MDGGHRACLEGGLKRVRQALRLVMGIEDELGHGAWKEHGTDSKRRNFSQGDEARLRKQPRRLNAVG